MTMKSTSLEQPISIPPVSQRCTTILEDTLEGYAGIRDVHFSTEDGHLRITYDPRILSPERALHLVRQAGQKAGLRVAQCGVKGEQACALCAAQMGESVHNHFSRLMTASSTQTLFREGELIISLNGATAPGSNQAVVESLFPSESSPEISSRPTFLFSFSRRRLEILFTLITALATLAAYLGGLYGISPAFQNGLFLTAYLLGGVFGLIDGINALREEHKLDVNLLMIFAAVGAAIIGQPLEGAILLFLFSLSNTLQTYALERNRQAIKKLLDLRPPTATVRHGSRIMTLPVEKLVIGDIVLVKPGERFPVDGEIVRGNSEVNQANITGESVPVFKKSGDAVFASTVNGNGALEVRVTRLAQDTTLARIVQMVEQAQNSKARTQTALDAFEQIYAWFVLGGAVFLTLIPILLFNQPFYPTFYRAMTWLVVASPCALVISTPASILSAIANGARNGILFKGGIHLEKTADLKVIAFDKTGTLTTGIPVVQSIIPAEGVTEEELLRLVASAESRSEHPLGNAILEIARQRNLPLSTASEFRAIPGQGIEAYVEGRAIWVGNERLFHERGVPVPPELKQHLNTLKEKGQTVMLAFTPGKWLGIFGLADSIRPNAREIVQSLKKVGMQKVVMLTGDNEAVAHAIAAQAGVDEVHAGLLPQDKVAVLETLRHRYGQIAMVGDGVNDAPALAAADVGIAMGGAGSDVALETADVVLMADDLTNLPHAIFLARRSRQIIWQNLTFALAVIVLLVVSAFGLNLPLPLGVVGHEGSTVLVVLNGLRLLALKKV
ncbi:copper-(or silver)-translocating P-type ATPase [Anaerolinea thermolimosa]|nr:heavy metal translocating P-type ATPase [Anaerolinea thermolimosa]GAP06220.1 copper-(or silver)-translocating P-type ATPase [Anaerolinea thermolimosa]